MPELTPEQELINLLGSDKRSLRIQAIVKLSRIGKSELSLKALSALLSTSDREESFFISQAIAKIAPKLRLSPEEYLKNLSASNNKNDVSAGSEQSSEQKKLNSNDFLSAKKENAPALLEIIRTKPNELPEEVLPSVGVFLGKFGDTTDSGFIVNYLTNHEDNLTLPYISAAEKIDSKILIPVLPNLLSSREPLVRTRAVKVLQKIDPDEAERHFINLLSSPQADNRLAALEISFLFPFERVKNYVLSLLTEEKDNDIFKACATLLASNPSQEVAMKLLDILESMPSQQRRPINLIFNILSNAIATAKILPPDQASPQALVTKWKQQRLKHFLHNVEIQLCSTVGEKREAIINWIDKNLKNPEVAEFLERLALNPQTEDVYQRLTNNNDNLVLPDMGILVSDTSNSQQQVETNSSPVFMPNQVVKEPKPSNTVEVPKNTISQKATSSEETESSNILDVPAVDKKQEKKQIKYLKFMEYQQFLQEKDKILQMAGNSGISIPVRVEALNLLLKLCPDASLKDLALKALEEDDSRLKTSGFKILERVAPDFLKGKLPELMLSNDMNIRLRAIRVGLKVDEKKSIESLEKLLLSNDENNRSYAVSCLALCPFRSVYVILLKALYKESNMLVANQIGEILLSNPDPVILYMLDKISALTSDPSLEMVVSKLRNKLEELLNYLPEEAKHIGIKEFDLKTDVSKTQKKESKIYSVENVRKLSSNKLSEKKKIEKQPPSKIQEFFKKVPPSTFIIICVSIFVAFGMIYAIINNGFNMSKYEKANRQNSIKSSKRSGRTSSKGNSIFKINNEYTLDAVITNVVSDSSIVVKCKNEEIIVKFENKINGFKTGDKINLTFKPYRTNPRGTLLAYGLNISGGSE